MDPPTEWDEYVVRSDGAAIQCYRAGSGPSIVLAHGWSDSSLRWVPLVEDLTGEYEVIAYDMRGHGRSESPETGYDLADRISDLRAVVRESELTNPVLVGHSVNAATVARTAAKYPRLCRGVVLEDPDGLHDVPDDEPDERVARVRDTTERFDGQTIDEIVEENYRGFDPVQARRLAAASLNLSPEAAEIFRHGYPSPLRNQFPEISCRTLLLRHDADIKTRVMDLDAVDSLPDGRVVHIPDAGHYVFDDEYNAAYAELRTFLRRG